MRKLYIFKRYRPVLDKNDTRTFYVSLLKINNTYGIILLPIPGDFMKL